MRYLQTRHAGYCSFHDGRCPPDVMRGAAAVAQCFGKVARKTNPISGNQASEEEPCIDADVPSEHGLLVLFDRQDVADGEQDSNYEHFNVRGNGFTTFQSHAQTNTVLTYVWPEDATNDTGISTAPLTQEELIANGKSLGLRALFDCVDRLQGQERWWWELSRRCRMQEEGGVPVPKDRACTLEWRAGLPGWRKDTYPRAGEKASSAAFEAWFDAVRYQISLNLHRMGIFGTNAENFLSKVRLCYARRSPYRYNSVYTEVEGVPVIYLGDSAGSTDFKKGLSCGRGLLCASEFALDTLDVVAQQLNHAGVANLKNAFQQAGAKYQRNWSSPEMVAEWSKEFDATFKYLQAGRLLAPPLQLAPLLQAFVGQQQLDAQQLGLYGAACCLSA